MFNGFLSNFPTSFAEFARATYYTSLTWASYHHHHPLSITKVQVKPKAKLKTEKLFSLYFYRSVLSTLYATYGTVHVVHRVKVIIMAKTSHSSTDIHFYFKCTNTFLFHTFAVLFSRVPPSRKKNTFSGLFLDSSAYQAYFGMVGN